jgi:hypothetical protein
VGARATERALEAKVQASIDALLAPVRRERDDLERKLRWSEWQCKKLENRVAAVARERDRWQRRAERQQQTIDELKAKLEEAQRAAHRQAAPFGRKKRKKKQDKKRPGRKRGHPAANRLVPDHIDEELYEPLESCPCCGSAVEDIQDLPPVIEVDIPPVRPHVRRYHTQSGYCGQCRQRVRSRHPEQTSEATGAAGVHVGPRAHALAVDLKHRIGMTYGQVQGLFALVFELKVCRATFVRSGQRIAGRCEPTYAALIETVRASAVVHADETGWYVTEAERKAWLWVFAVAGPEPVTVYVIATSRGGEVAAGVLGDDFPGRLCVDGWAGYIQLPCEKGQCGFHIMRRARDLLEVQTQGAARFPHAVLDLYEQAFALDQMRSDLHPDDYAGCVQQLEGELTCLLGGDIHDPANLRFANHLRNHHDELLRFLHVPELPPTNNEGEREIRPAVVVRKISAGNRTLRGAHTQEVLASVSRTAQRNGHTLFELVPLLLRQTNRGLVLPLLAAWHDDRYPLLTLEADHGRPDLRTHAVRLAGRHARRNGSPALPLIAADARPPPC